VRLFAKANRGVNTSWAPEDFAADGNCEKLVSGHRYNYETKSGPESPYKSRRKKASCSLGRKKGRLRMAPRLRFFLLLSEPVLLAMLFGKGGPA
jgi:hypothetical protein